MTNDSADGPGRTTPPRMSDVPLADEIELYGELVVAASESDGPLDLREIDRALGLA